MWRPATRIECPTATAALLVPRRPGSRWYSYGIVLVVNVLLVLPMVQFSILAWRRIAVFPRAEAAAAILAIGAAALLSAFPLPPARQPEAAEEASPSSAAASPIPSGAALTLGSHASSVLVGLTIEPARPGANELTIYVLGLDGPGPTAALPFHVRSTEATFR